jgi:hypothetical protein
MNAQRIRDHADTRILGAQNSNRPAGGIAKAKINARTLAFAYLSEGFQASFVATPIWRVKSPVFFVNERRAYPASLEISRLVLRFLVWNEDLDIGALPRDLKIAPSPSTRSKAGTNRLP